MKKYYQWDKTNFKPLYNSQFSVYTKKNNLNQTSLLNLYENYNENFFVESLIEILLSL